MTSRQKITLTVGTAVPALLAATVLWLLLGNSGARKTPAGERAFAADGGDCASASLDLYNKFEWETGAFILDNCEPAQREISDPGSKISITVKSAEAFENTMRGWSPPWPAQDGSVSAMMSPEEADGRISQMEKTVGGYPDTPAAALATLAKAALLFYLGRFDEAAFTLNEDNVMRIAPEHAGWLKVMSLARAGRSMDAVEAADRFLREHPDAATTGDIKIWESRALAAAGRMQEAVNLTMTVASDTAENKFTRGRALLLAAELYGKQGDMRTRVKLLVEIAQNYPDFDCDHDLDADFDDRTEVPLLAIDQRVALAGYFIEKERGFPARRFLLPVKNALAPEGLLLLARAEFLTERYKSAKNILDSLTTRSVPVEIRGAACILSARIYIRTAIYERGAASLGGCIANYPAVEAEALWYLAKNFDFAGKGDLQIKTLMRLTETEPARPDNDDSYMRIARWMFGADKKQKAIEAYRSLESNFPDSPAAAEALFWIARAAYEAGENETAERIFDNLQKRFPYSYFNFRGGQYLAQMGHPDKSLAFPEMTMNDVIPKDNSRVRCGHVLRLLNLTELALREYEAAAAAAPEESAIGTARTLLDMDQRSLSTKAIEARAAIDPAFYYRVMTDTSLTDLLYPRFFVQDVKVEAANYGMDPVWPMAIIRQESRFNPNARSSSNAIGLMQIIPSTGDWIAGHLNVTGFNPNALFDPDTNIRFGLWYFDYLLKKFNGNYVLAVAAYNGGPGNVGRWVEKLGASDIDLFIEKIPRDETRSYTKKVFHNYYIYNYLLNGTKQ
jgi:soluble lytic murein transglycosylase-like protein